MATGTTTAKTFACDLNETQFKLMFAEKAGSLGTFGLVKDEADWLEKRDDPDFLVAGIPPGIGDLRQFERKVFGSGKLFMPDGTRVRHWGFRDENGVESYPSTPIRVMGGDLVQGHLKSAIRQHTIHWHGIEPDMDNDGVGHTSFEITGNYIYQWRAHPANAGTYFYHCHVNTVLHVQMGLWGALIIDPYEPEPHPDGKKLLHDSPDEWRYKPQYERIWALNAIDPEWHELNHAAGLCFEDAGLNDFRPKYFLIGKHPQDPDGPPIRGDAEQPIALTLPAGENGLVRSVNANYHPIEIDWGTLTPDVHLVEADGRGIRTGIDLDGLGTGESLKAIPFGDIDAENRRFSPAERYTYLINSQRTGTHVVTFRYRHWITQEVVGVAKTTVTIA